jgi:protein transport protein SEC31
MVKLNEINYTATFAWSHDSIPTLATGSAAGVIDDDFSSSSTLQFHSLYDKAPIVSVDADAKFYDLDWSKNKTLLAGALENGTIQFWNTESLPQGKVEAVAKGVKHSGAIKSLQFNPVQHNVLVSGGANGEIFIWDTNKLENLSPFAPGTAMTPMDNITSVAWNNSVSHIFGAAGSAGYTSIWDLKTKKEVLHLTYTSPTGTRASLSTVAWHPTQSTKLITASEADGAPVILTWDLRNSNAPETILSGHKKGVLSLDWNSRDPTFLLSCGKDNTTMLWNPLTGENLAQFPTTANWAFKTRFAPSAPDIFATSSFDKKVIVQTLQDTSPPVSKRISSVSENDFWNELSTTETQQPEYFVKQTPNWFGRQSSVSFGFGAKIVTIAKTGDKTSEIKILKAQLPGSAVNDKLQAALDSRDFSPVIESRLENSYEGINKSDWELLEKLSEGDIYKKFIGLEISDDEEKPPVSGEDFYNNLKQQNTYVPSGTFQFDDEASDLVNALLTKNLEKAVEICLNEGKFNEASIIALNGPESLKKKVSDFYFSKNAEKNPISRLLFSISSSDVSDIVENGDLSHWKEIGTAINTYSKDTSVYKTQFVKLGDRILAEKNRNDAILNYVNASALDKVADIWNSELKELEHKILEDKNISAYDAHFESLTEFVEKFSAYRATLNLDAPVSETASSLSTLLEYVDIISTSGQFELASKILSLLSTEVPSVKLEQDRIDKASGKNAVQQHAARTAGTNRYGSLNAAGVPANTYQARGRAPSANPYMATSAPVVPSTAAQPTAPLYGYQPTAQSPYAPQAPAHSTSSNPYKPVDSNPAQSSSSSVAPPPKNVRKVETEGWNDLPSHFHKQPARRPTAATQVNASQLPNGPSNSATVSLPRTNSYANAPSIPPPPRSVSRPPKQPSAEPTPTQSPAMLAVNRYAPASPQPNISALNNLTANAPTQPSVYAPPTPAVPPKNPYAPTGQTPAAPVSNPYGPPIVSPIPPPQTNPYGTPNGVVTQQANPYGPPQAGANKAPVDPYSAPAASNPVRTNNPYSPQVQYTPAPAQGYGAPPMGQAASQPPLTSTPPNIFGAPPKVTNPAESLQQSSHEEPSKVKYPSGDRSHIPERQKKVVQVLESTYDVCKAGMPEKYEKQVVDTGKRLTFLFDHLNNQDLLTEPTLELLDQLCDKLSQRDYPSALDLHLEIATNHSHEGGNWILGIKRLIQFAEVCN